MILRECEHSTGDRASGMDDGFEMRVVVVEHVRADARDQCSAKRIEGFGAPEEVGCGAVGIGQDGAERAHYRLLIGASDGYACPVDDRSDGLLANAVWDL